LVIQIHYSRIPQKPQYLFSENGKGADPKGAAPEHVKKECHCEEGVARRGNLPDFRTFLFENPGYFALFGGSPHQSADWFAMTTFDKLLYKLQFNFRQSEKENNHERHENI
jgi:hypothetical protein